MKIVIVIRVRQPFGSSETVLHKTASKKVLW